MTDADLMADAKSMVGSQLEQSLADAREEADTLAPGQLAYRTARARMEVFRAEIERRKAIAADSNLDWLWLLESPLGAYTRAPEVTLREVLRPYCMDISMPPTFLDDTGQVVLLIKMGHDPADVECVAAGLRNLFPHLRKSKRGLSFRVFRGEGYRGKTWMHLLADGRAALETDDSSTEFVDLRQALHHIQERLAQEVHTWVAPRSDGYRSKSRSRSR